uniref:Biotin carboxyl carrier protein of acetyl-CoA carboxylase n=1 Tax=Chondria sp. (in: red algae) TaxID=1982705 RepID=A0A1Z1MEH5_9FLOR|nr:acetyl-CoA carboxylase biotin carboxyl carrier protein [Chondria sp. (in: red algae)]
MESLNYITNFIKCAKNSNLEKITIGQNNYKIIINKKKANNSSTISQNNVNYTRIDNKKNNKKINKALENRLDITKNIIEQPHKYSTIISPMVGNFYRSPAPSDPPFVDINQIVKPKQTVCIIEAMKLMNEIESEIQGEIVEILVKDGDIVDCGQALMKVKIK